MSTIREVAELANVSPATVSRVLNYDTTYKMTEDTKERVWQAAAKLGYQAPVRKRKQISDPPEKKESLHIGCIISTTLKQFVDPYFMTILSSIEERLGELGHSVATVTTSKELQNQYLSRRDGGGLLDGLILMDSLEEEVYQFIRQRVKVGCMVGIDTFHKDFDNVGYDHTGVSEMAVCHLYEKGYREIGFIGGSNRLKQNFNRSRRYQGFRSAMNYLDMPINTEWVLDSKWDDMECERLVSRLCREQNLPRAFYAASDLMAIAALNAFSVHGIRVPEEVAVIGVSDINIAKYANPPLTTIDISSREMGIEAANLLVQRLNGEQISPRRVLMPYHLIERKST